MSDSPSVLERFNRWFVAPLELLKTLPDGDGAFIALSIGCSLCERYYRAKSNTEDKWRCYKFKEDAAKDFCIEKSDFDDFWNIYRHGMQHQGTPKQEDKRNNDGNVIHSYKWLISCEFGELPTFDNSTPNETTIRLDPFKFADLIIQKFLSDPETLAKVSSHAFRDIFFLDTSLKDQQTPQTFPDGWGVRKQHPNVERSHLYPQESQNIPATGCR